MPRRRVLSVLVSTAAGLRLATPRDLIVCRRVSTLQWAARGFSTFYGPNRRVHIGCKTRFHGPAGCVDGRKVVVFSPLLSIFFPFLLLLLLCPQVHHLAFTTLGHPRLALSSTLEFTFAHHHPRSPTSILHPTTKVIHGKDNARG